LLNVSCVASVKLEDGLTKASERHADHEPHLARDDYLRRVQDQGQGKDGNEDRSVRDRWDVAIPTTGPNVRRRAPSEESRFERTH
jgi:hypothetical protein